MVTQTRRPLLRELAALAIRCGGASLLARHMLARGKVTIILYHDPTPEHFERHLRYLSGRFQFTTMAALDHAYASGDWSGLPARGLIVTFDDGHRGNHRLLPLFRRFGLRPTIFLVSGVVGTERHYWFAHDGVKSNALKGLPDDERLRRLEAQFGFTETREYTGDRQGLSLDEIRDMAPHVDFEAHTRFHPILPACGNDKSRAEIQDGRIDLEQLLGRPVRYFSYPNGEYCDRDVEHVRTSGFRLARTIDVGWNGPNTDPFRLRIAGVTDDASVNVLAAQLSGVSMYLRYRLRGGRGGRFPASNPHRGTT